MKDADFSAVEKNNYLDEMEARQVASAINSGFCCLPITTQFEMQKTMAAAQQGSIVQSWGGRKFDARDVKNGTGGKRGHRAQNNKLSLNDSSIFSNSCSETEQVQHALKVSMDDLNDEPVVLQVRRDKSAEKNIKKNKTLVTLMLKGHQSLKNYMIVILLHQPCLQESTKN